VLAAGAVSTEPVSAQTPSAPAGGTSTSTAPGTISALFTCDAGKTVAAVFHNGTQSSVKLTLSDGRELTLPQALSGSGARYANDNESFVFWNKGDTAFIEENGKTTYSGCIAKK
jgi:membrane-bound inhibitor of C-type lysozyme